MSYSQINRVRRRSARKGHGPAKTPARAKAAELAKIAWAFSRQQLQQIAPSDPISFLIETDPLCSKAFSAAVDRLLVEEEGT